MNDITFCCNHECPIRQSCGRGDFSVIRTPPVAEELVSMAMWEPKKYGGGAHLPIVSLFEACGVNMNNGEFYQCDGYLEKAQ